MQPLLHLIQSQNQTPPTPTRSCNCPELAQGMTRGDNQGEKWKELFLQARRAPQRPLLRRRGCTTAPGLCAGPSFPPRHPSPPQPFGSLSSPAPDHSRPFQQQRGGIFLPVSTAASSQCRGGRAESIPENEKPKPS